MKLSKKTLLIIIGFLAPAFFISSLLIINLYILISARWNEVEIFLLLMGVALLFSVPVSISLWLAFSAAVIHPLKEFNRISKIIVSGNLGMRVIHNSEDELGELAGNINSIINNLTKGVQGMANALRDEKEKEKQLSLNYQELNKAKAKDDALLGSIGEAVIAIDQSRKIILFNKTAERLTGYTATEAMGHNFADILKFEPEKNGEKVPDFISSALNGAFDETIMHIVFVQKNGQKIPIIQVTSPIINQDRQISGAIVVLKDITRERQVDKMKDEFISVASHELRTPMTAIKGLISMIFEGDYGQINPQLKEPLSDIASSTERLINLVNDMLDVSRIESGRAKYSLTEVNIADLVQEIISLLTPIASQKQIQLRFNGQNARVIQADANKVKQILSNLIGNSLKFTDRGFIEVILTIHDQLLLVSVRDTGMGIKPEDQKKLFSKFQQITDAQAGRPVGTGLGLYISREFARKMGGDLWISFSAPAQGSVFTLSVPLANTELAKQISRTIMLES